MDDVTKSSDAADINENINTSKNAERKMKKFTSVISSKKKHRKQEKQKKKIKKIQEIHTLVEKGSYLSKRDQKIVIEERLERALTEGQKICIDCSLESTMSKKECSKFAQQFCRLYGSNRKAEKPACLYLTGLNTDGELYRQCLAKCDGFLKYKVHRRVESFSNIFSSPIVYLTPDSTHILTHIDPDTVYVIGGLVDESVAKNETLTLAKSLELSTARLPIAEYMHRDSASRGPPSPALAINQVMDILLAYQTSQDWSSALQAGVPPRTGYRSKDNPSSSSDR